MEEEYCINCDEWDSRTKYKTYNAWLKAHKKHTVILKQIIG